MKNHNKHDNVYVNVIKSESDVKNASKSSVGTSDKTPFCVYGHKRHAAGSKFVSDDGSELVCKEDSAWQKN